MAKESIPILLIEDNPTDVVLLREALEEVASFSFQFAHHSLFYPNLKRLNAKAITIQPI